MQELKYYYVERRHPNKDLLTYRDAYGIHRVEIISQPSDKLTVFQDKNTTYALSSNGNYVRVESFRAGERADDLFIQTPEDIETFIGKQGLSFPPLDMIVKIARHLKK